jgi:hypothetical protein
MCMVIDPKQAPMRSAQVDVDAPRCAPIRFERATTVLVPVRMHRPPSGVIGTRLPASADLPSGPRTAACTHLGSQPAGHARRDWTGCGSRQPPTAGAAPTTGEEPPPIGVIVATGERPSARRLASLDSPKCEVVVIDDDPDTDRAGRTAEDALGPVCHLHTRRRGVARAHNLGAREAGGRIAALTDDDVTVDADRLAAIAEAFADGRVGCVSGSITPGEPETPQQPMPERRGGYSRGLEAEVFPAPPGADPDPGDQLLLFTAGRTASGLSR